MEKNSAATSPINIMIVIVKLVVNIDCPIKKNMFFKILLHQPSLTFNQKQNPIEIYMKLKYQGCSCGNTL